MTNPFPGEPILSFFGVSYVYEDAVTPALHAIDFRIADGERIAIVGPGGAGKSTLLRMLCGYAETLADHGSWEGTLQLRGQEGTRYSALEVAGRIALVAQDPETGNVLDDVEDELAFGPENLLVPPQEIEERMQKALDAVGLPTSVRTARIRELSGGQQQRIAIAAVLAMDPELFAFDDAAANLDAAAAQLLMETQRRLQQRGHTLITAAPRWDGAADEADRVLLLADGRILADGTPADVLATHEETLVELGCLPSSRKIEEGSKAITSPTAPLALPPAAPLAAPPVASAADEPTLRVRHLRFAYPGSAQPVLHRMDAEFRPGEVTALLGPNGSGKTTFGKLVAGLLPSPPGALTLHGRELASYTPQELSLTVGYVFQQPEHQFVADTVFEECAFGLRAKRPNFTLGREDLERVESQLRAFGLLSIRGRHPQRLSVADRRLLNLASVLLLEPALVVLDEPTAGLDYAATDRFMRHIADFASRDGTVLLITHDTYVVERWTTRQVQFGDTLSFQ
jgi:energy-coupling factor transporter ATP-binding protein EcfA2